MGSRHEGAVGISGGGRVTLQQPAPYARITVTIEAPDGSAATYVIPKADEIAIDQDYERSVYDPYDLKLLAGGAIERLTFSCRPLVDWDLGRSFAVTYVEPKPEQQEVP